MSGECAGRKGVRPPRPKTKGAVLCGSAPLNGCGFGGGAAKRRPRFLASLPWFRTTGLLACPRPPPSLPGGFSSSGPMGSSGLQWRVRAGFSPASRASCGESPSGFRPDIMTFRRSLSRKGISDEHRRAAGSVTGARLGRRRTLSSVTTAQTINSAPCVRRLPACETDIPVGFSAWRCPPGDLLFAPGGANSPNARQHSLCQGKFRIWVSTESRGSEKRCLCQPTPAAPRGSPGPFRRRPRAPGRWPTRRRRSPPSDQGSPALPVASRRDG